MSKVVAVANQKGGVGKTTTVVNLAAAIACLPGRQAQAGRKVLVVDLDPQANATSGLGVDKRTVHPSIYEGLLGHVPMAELIRPHEIAGLSLIPSHPHLSGAEIELVQSQGREQRLKAALAPMREQFEILFIDCPPSLGLLTVNALAAADSLLIPLQCEYYALEGLTQLIETIRLVQERVNPQLVIEGVVLTMADQRTKLTADVITEVRGFFKEKVYRTVIPRSVRLSEAPSYGKPVTLYAPGSIGAQRYIELAQEFLGIEQRSGVDILLEPLSEVQSGGEHPDGKDIGIG